MVDSDQGPLIGYRGAISLRVVQTVVLGIGGFVSCRKQGILTKIAKMMSLHSAQKQDKEGFWSQLVANPLAPIPFSKPQRKTKKTDKQNVHGIVRRFFWGILFVCFLPLKE